jgi:hypothetical protein
MSLATRQTPILVCLLAFVSAVQGGDEKVTALRKEQLESARKAFELNWQSYQAKVRFMADPESLCRWSKRWLDAEEALAKKKSERISALEKHIARIKMLEKSVAAVSKVEGGLRGHLAMVTFFRLEAEILLAEAKAGSKQKEK